MRRLMTRTLITVGAASAAVALAASAASAATFNITGESGDHAITANAGATTLTTPNTTLRCTSSSAHAINVFNSPGQSDSGHIGDINNLTFNNCTLAGFISFSVTTNAPTSPWALNAASESGGVVQGKVQGAISAHIHGLSISCEADITGTLVPGTYTNSNHTLGIPGSGQDLHVTGPVTGCGGLLATGDPASFSGNYVVQAPDTALAITQTG